MLSLAVTLLAFAQDAPEAVGRDSTRAYGVAVSPDESLVAVARHQHITIWDVAGKKERRALRDAKASFYGVAFSPDGKTLAAGDFGGRVRLFDLESGEERRVMKDGERVGSVHFMPDGKSVVTGSLCSDERGFATGNVRLWEVATGKLVRTLEGALGPCAVSPDGKTIATNAPGYEVKLWSAETGVELRSLGRGSFYAGAIGFSPDGARVLMGGGRDDLRVWRVKDGGLVRAVKTCFTSAAAFAPEGGGLWVLSLDGLSEIEADGKERRRVQVGVAQACCLAVGTKGNLLVTGGCGLNGAEDGPAAWIVNVK